MITYNNENKMRFYTTKDVAEILGCSMAAARKIMMSPGFPLIKVGKNLKVNKTAFEEWSMKRHV